MRWVSPLYCGVHGGWVAWTPGPETSRPFSGGPLCPQPASATTATMASATAVGLALTLMVFTLPLWCSPDGASRGNHDASRASLRSSLAVAPVSVAAHRSHRHRHHQHAACGAQQRAWSADRDNDADGDGEHHQARQHVPAENVWAEL